MPGFFMDQLLREYQRVSQHGGIDLVQNNIFKVIN